MLLNFLLELCDVFFEFGVEKRQPKSALKHLTVLEKKFHLFIFISHFKTIKNLNMIICFFAAIQPSFQCWEI